MVKELSLADKEGMAVGDQLLAVGPINLRSASYDEAKRMLLSAGPILKLQLQYRGPFPSASDSSELVDGSLPPSNTTSTDSLHGPNGVYYQFIPTTRINQSINQSINVHCSMTQENNQSINGSIIKSSKNVINQSINQGYTTDMLYFPFFRHSQGLPSAFNRHCNQRIPVHEVDQ